VDRDKLVFAWLIDMCDLTDLLLSRTSKEEEEEEEEYPEEEYPEEEYSEEEEEEEIYPD